MTDDLLFRLRIKGPLHATRCEAADEIERLEAAKRGALKVADERTMQNAALRQAIKTYLTPNRTLTLDEKLNALRSALEQTGDGK